MKGEDSASVSASASASAGEVEDLYGDLDLPEADVQAQELESRLAEAQRRIRTLEGKVALVGTECVKLRAENETLRRNASALYRTARREVGRKDAEIAALREEVRGLRAGGGGQGQGQQQVGGHGGQAGQGHQHYQQQHQQQQQYHHRQR